MPGTKGCLLCEGLISNALVAPPRVESSERTCPCICNSDGRCRYQRSYRWKGEETVAILYYALFGRLVCSLGVPWPPECGWDLKCAQVGWRGEAGPTEVPLLRSGSSVDCAGYFWLPLAANEAWQATESQR
jgi:hypothetical protein